VTGGDEIRVERAGAAPQPIELDLAVAHHAWIGRPAGEIFGNKISNYARAKIGAEIDHIKWKAHPFGDAARILEVIVRAAGAATLRSVRRCFGCKAHRDPDHIIALFAKKRGRDRTVDPT